MKKNFVILLTLLCFTTLTFGQTNFGVKGGLNFANLAVDEDQIDDNSTKVGFTAGLFVQTALLGIDWLMIQPEALYTIKGAKYEAGTTTVKANLHYLDIPVSGVVRILNSPLTIHAGFQYSWLARAKYEYESQLFTNGSVVDDNRDNYQQWDFGVVGGLGLSFENLLIEVRATRGLRNVEKDRTIFNTAFTANDTKNFGFQLTAGISF